MNHRRLIIFTRYPAPGRVKTRLIPALGVEGAVGLHRRLVLRTLRTAIAACRDVNAELEVHFAGGSETAMRHWLGPGCYRPQGEGDLGARMGIAFTNSLQRGDAATILIGSDCPGLTPEILVEGFDRLSRAPVVFGPAIDGGYYLIGMTQMFPSLFCNIKWGTEMVLADSLKAVGRDGLKPSLLTPLSDLDRPEDLPLWRCLTAAQDTELDRVSVIIPALNEAGNIVKTLKSIGQCEACEVILVDGGSSDETRQLAVQAGAKVLATEPGRAAQMNAGATRAAANVLLFLHADTCLPANWKVMVTEILHRPGVAAGAFGFQIEGRFPGKSIVESVTQCRSKWLQQPYGDQGLFLKRSLFEEMGGFVNMPIMEDYEFLGRLRRLGRIAIAPQAVLTSGRRWQKLGFLRTTLINQLMLAGYHLGVRPTNLAKFYRAKRG